jgi:hypothetical protein
MLHDFDSADAFSAAYRWHGGIVDHDHDAEVFWAVSDILGFLPDPTQIITALIHHRTDLPDQIVRERLEHLLMITIGNSCR